MSNGTDAVTISGSAGKAQFSGGRFNGDLDNYILACFQQLTGGQGSFPSRRRSTYDQRHAGGGHHGARQHRSGVVDVSVVAYQWDRAARLSFRDADAGRLRDRPVRADGQFAARDHAGRSGGDPAAGDPRRDGGQAIRCSRCSRMAYRDFKLDRFLSLNGLAAKQPIGAGQKVSWWCTERDRRSRQL